ncbi:MAG: PDZ domain-containing protein [Streptococcaceae bacterium]|nr:PDZ domain-containing protein [Streptococcaceae bacterium]
MSKLFKNRFVKIILFVSAIFIIFNIPIPYYLVETPGKLINLRPLVTVNGKKDNSKGAFYLTAVAFKKLSLIRLIHAKFFSDFEVIQKKEVALQGIKSDEYWKILRYELASSENLAINQAAKLAGVPTFLNFKGIYIASIEKKSKFYGKLSIGDKIINIDGKTFHSSKEIIDYIQSQKVGKRVKLTFKRDKEKKEATGKLIHLKRTNMSGIGIGISDYTTIKTKIPIKIDADEIGGPSGGLMFTLQIYQMLSGKDLKCGRKIAGTGTIEKDGSVGRIGGIDKKVVAANASEVDIFFAPDDKIFSEWKKTDKTLTSNYQEAKQTAKKLGTKMKIIPVKKVKDALNYLKKLK